MREIQRKILFHTVNILSNGPKSIGGNSKSLIRFASGSTSAKTAETASCSDPPNPNLIQEDWIGPPDKTSNLRPIMRHVPKNETPLQQKLRLRQVEVDEYNQKFWTNHNKRFFEERDAFVAANKTHPEENLSADQMSVFYKSFLDKNWKIHFYYNVSWYIKNISLMLLACRVELQRITNTIRRK
ncbi:COA8 family protein CG14806, mitochondrial [Lutzomyia longipalpis]|uniref:COA8 family protein CG14806, mitochondrial n=1 Tax=Lutzomyia longipalpis TaxID=7200 RepID=UPI0024836817|nr:COA8 family protein CG14806, mitochondrial [Lutzomyia longipalpis]